jgi:hypothetical protein
LQRVAFHFGVEDARPEFCGDTRIARDLDPAFRFAASLSTPGDSPQSSQKYPSIVRLQNRQKQQPQWYAALSR